MTSVEELIAAIARMPQAAQASIISNIFQVNETLRDQIIGFHTVNDEIQAPVGISRAAGTIEGTSAPAGTIEDPIDLTADSEEENQVDKDTIINRLMEKINSDFVPVRKLEATIGISSIRRLVVALVEAIIDNEFDECGRARWTYRVLINGDPQRGKSDVKALCSFVTKNLQEFISRRVFTLVGTVMVAWVEGLEAKFRRIHNGGVGPSISCEDDISELTFFSDEGTVDGSCSISAATDDEDETDNENEIVIETIGGHKRMKKGDVEDLIIKAIREGGVLLFARVLTQMKRFIDIHNKALLRLRDMNELSPASILILDEADAMLGSGVGGSAKYEEMLNEIIGINGRSQNCFYKPCLLIDVSATNVLPFLSTVHYTHHSPIRAPVLKDIISFVEASEDDYAGVRNYEKFRHPTTNEEIFLERPRKGQQEEDSVEVAWRKDDVNYATPARSENLVCGACVDMALEVFRTPHACMLDTVAQAVRVHVPCNMSAHAQKLENEVTRVMGKAPDGVFVFVHGCHAVYPGKIGVRFTKGEYARQCRTELLEQVRQACDEEGVSAPSRLSQGGDISQQDLEHLLRKIEREAVLQDSMYKPLVTEAGGNLSTRSLSVVLHLLRTLKREDLPIIVVGHGLLKRSVSVVSTDLRALPLAVPNVCVTHLACFGAEAANCADEYQIFCRACTVLTQFYSHHGFKTIKVLAPEHTWKTAQAWIEWNKKFLNEDYAKEAVAKLAQLRREECDDVQLVSMVGMKEIYELLVRPNPLHRNAVLLTNTARRGVIEELQNDDENVFDALVQTQRLLQVAEKRKRSRIFEEHDNYDSRQPKLPRSQQKASNRRRLIEGPISKYLQESSFGVRCSEIVNYLNHEDNPANLPINVEVKRHDVEMVLDLLINEGVCYKGLDRMYYRQAVL